MRCDTQGQEVPYRDDHLSLTRSPSFFALPVTTVRNGCIADHGVYSDIYRTTHVKLSLQWVINMYFNPNVTVFERNGLLKSALNRKMGPKYRINTSRVKHLIEVD